MFNFFEGGFVIISYSLDKNVEEKKMKKTARSILFVVVLLLGFVFFTTDVSALEVSKWNTDSIPKLTTSEGLEVLMIYQN